MKSITQELLKFIIQTEFEDLPQAVVHEAKRVLLDSVGCAIGGRSTDKGKFSIQLAKRLGGSPESSIIGAGDKVLCTSAAFANGELINALDYDAVDGHHAPNVIPAPLALAESEGASGKDLIVAIALGLEISSRLAAISPHRREIVREGPDKGKRFFMPPIYGYSYCVFGGTASAGKILKLDSQKMSHALGIAGYSAPIPEQANWVHTAPSSMTKYLSSGWISVAEVTSALLAQTGYVGDSAVLDGEHSFWKFISGAKWEPSIITKGIGDEWRFLTIEYKLYPFCGIAHTPLDCFFSIINENDLIPEDIEGVRVFLDPEFDKPVWRNKELRTHIDAQFSLPYAFSVAAHRVKIGPQWQSLDTIENPKIRKFMEKVSIEPHLGSSKALIEGSYDFRDQFYHSSRLSMVEVAARGKIFREERKYAKATVKDEELVDKFRNNASGILPSDKINRAVKSILELDKMENVASVFGHVS